MKLKLYPLAAAVLGALALPASAQTEPSHVRFGVEKPVNDFTMIQVKNFQDESLGRIKDLGIDLVNGRIVVVLVQVDGSLGVGNRIVSVPPAAFLADQAHETYRLNISTEEFKESPDIDLSKWENYGRSEKVAATYKRYGQEPYFLEEGHTASKTAERPKVKFGYMERSSKMLDLPVGNHQGEKFGKVWSLALDIPKGRILNVVVLAPGNFKTKTIIPATALEFNDKRDGLLLDSTKIEFRDEPRYVFTEAAYGQDANYKRESYKGEKSVGPIAQGTSYRDIDSTILINKGVRAAKIPARNVEVGTMDSRVTLRGWVNTADEKRRIGEIAIAATRLEQVDNQIVVGKPTAAN